MAFIVMFAALQLERELNQRLEHERDKLREAFRELQLELLRRRIFAAKAERIDTAQLQLEFAEKRKALEALVPGLELEIPEVVDDLTDSNPQPADGDDGPPRKPPRKRPTGRRNLGHAELPIERLVSCDTDMEALVSVADAERIGVEEASSVKWLRGGPIRVVIARVKYRKKPGKAPEPEFAKCDDGGDGGEWCLGCGCDDGPFGGNGLGFRPLDSADDRHGQDAPGDPSALDRDTLPACEDWFDKFGQGLPLHRQEKTFETVAVFVLHLLCLLLTPR